MCTFHTRPFDCLDVCPCCVSLFVHTTVEQHAAHRRNCAQVAIWQGTCYLTPLLGAYLADAHLGRFKVIAIFSTIYFLGTLLLTLTRLLPGLVPEVWIAKNILH